MFFESIDQSSLWQVCYGGYFSRKFLIFIAWLIKPWWKWRWQARTNFPSATNTDVTLLSAPIRRSFHVKVRRLRCGCERQPPYIPSQQKVLWSRVTALTSVRTRFYLIFSQMRNFNSVLTRWAGEKYNVPSLSYGMLSCMQESLLTNVQSFSTFISSMTHHLTD